jgi:hypothetical protein
MVEIPVIFGAEEKYHPAFSFPIEPRVSMTQVDENIIQNIILRSRVGADSILHLDIPVIAFNMDVQVMLTVKPIHSAKPFPMTRLEEGLGCVKYRGKAQSLQDMEQGIIKAARQKWLNENSI